MHYIIWNHPSKVHQWKEMKHKKSYVYIYYRCEDRQFLLDFNSTSTKESLYIVGKNYRSYIQIYYFIVMDNVVQQKM